MTSSRRSFLLSSSTVAALASLPVAARTRASGPPRRTFHPSVVQAGETLAGVEYTDAERELIAQDLEEHLELLRARRSVPLELDDGPALRFDPLLPGRALHVDHAPFAAPSSTDVPLPDDDEAIAYAPVTQLSAWIKRRKLRCTRLTNIYLERLQRLGPRLSCVVTLLPEQALARAKELDDELDRGRWRGSLHGIVWGAKDILDTRGVRTTFGARPFADRIATRDATVVRKLEAAGANLVAKLTTGALAYGDIWYGGTTRNPWNLEEGASGSSAGPASAVAAGLCAFAIGSETLGSIISPSVRCGATGLRPTFGRVSRAGAMPLCWSLDKLGPLARTVTDTALVLDAIRGHDVKDADTRDAPFAFDEARDVRGLRVGFDMSWFTHDNADARLDGRALGKLRKTGLKTVEVKLPELPYNALLICLLAESAAAFEALTMDGRDDDLTWQAPQAWPNTFRLARFLPAVDLVQADRLRRKVMEAMAAVFDEVDALIAPPFTSPLLTITNFTGHPQLVLRSGMMTSATRAQAAVDPAVRSPQLRRVPHGITLTGRLFDEATLLSIGRHLESELDVWHERPPLS